MWRACCGQLLLLGLCLGARLATYRQMGEKYHSSPKTVSLQGVTIKVIPALHDNYMYLIIDEVTKDAAVVDAVEPDLVMETLNQTDCRITKILTTHHHPDHAGGNKKLLSLFPELPVYGGDERVEGVTTTVANGDRLMVGTLAVDCLATPCHTTGDICYLFRLKNNPMVVFTGDTLTVSGCGRFLEGTANQMYDNLYNKLGSLPNDTLVFCGHEFTYPNLMFASYVDAYNRDVGRKLDWAEKMMHERKPTVPSTIGEEWDTNPFMRVDTPDVQWRSDSSDPIKTLQHIRNEKDNHKII